MEPCIFGEGTGAYDAIPELAFGLTYHGITYADEAYSPETTGKMTVRFWRPTMQNGIIHFARPEQCPFTRPVREMEIKPFGEALNNFQGVDICEREVR